MRWILPIIIETVLKFLYGKLQSYQQSKKEQAQKKADEAAKAEKLKQAKTEKEVDDAITDSLGDL